MKRRTDHRCQRTYLFFFSSIEWWRNLIALRPLINNFIMHIKRSHPPPKPISRKSKNLCQQLFTSFSIHITVFQKDSSWNWIYHVIFADILGFIVSELCWTLSSQKNSILKDHHDVSMKLNSELKAKHIGDPVNSI